MLIPGDLPGQGRAVPMLQDAMLAEQRIEHRRAISRGKNITDVRPASRIHQNRLLRRDWRPAQYLLVNQNPHRRDHEIARQCSSRCQHHALNSVRLLPAAPPVPCMHRHAMDSRNRDRHRPVVSPA